MALFKLSFQISGSIPPYDIDLNGADSFNEKKIVEQEGLVEFRYLAEGEYQIIATAANGECVINQDVLISPALEPILTPIKDPILTPIDEPTDTTPDVCPNSQNVVVTVNQNANGSYLLTVNLLDTLTTNNSTVTVVSSTFETISKDGDSGISILFYTFPSNTNKEYTVTVTRTGCSDYSITRQVGSSNTGDGNLGGGSDPIEDNPDSGDNPTGDRPDEPGFQE